MNFSLLISQQIISSGLHIRNWKSAHLLRQRKGSLKITFYEIQVSEHFIFFQARSPHINTYSTKKSQPFWKWCTFTNFLNSRDRSILIPHLQFQQKEESEVSSSPHQESLQSSYVQLQN